MLKDQKERIKLLSLEALVAYASIGNKFSVKEIVYQLVEQSTYEAIAERMDMELVPFLNPEGALEIPYLDQLEIVAPSNNNSAMIGNVQSRRDSTSYSN